MKPFRHRIANTFIAGCIVGALIAGVASFAFASQHHSLSKQAATQNEMQTVVVVGTRMTDVEKWAFDFAEAHPETQTVIVTGKRLTPKEKLAYDQQMQTPKQTKAQYNKTLKTSV